MMEAMVYSFMQKGCSPRASIAGDVQPKKEQSYFGNTLNAAKVFMP
ncbi:hypothetical protein [Cohnella sp. JJ-181]|nr:hypothetical protein [Cohnella sp. JJ-181]